MIIKYSYITLNKFKGNTNKLLLLQLLIGLTGTGILMLIIDVLPRFIFARLCTRGFQIHTGHSCCIWANSCSVRGRHYITVTKINFYLFSEIYNFEYFDCTY